MPCSLQPVSPGRLYSLVCAGEVRPGLGWPEFKAQVCPALYPGPVHCVAGAPAGRAAGSQGGRQPHVFPPHTAGLAGQVLSSLPLQSCPDPHCCRRREGEPSKFQVDPRPGHAMIALSAARQPELQSAERVLELAHHTLKSNLHRSAAFSLQPRQIQAEFGEQNSTTIYRVLCRPTSLAWLALSCPWRWPVLVRCTRPS